MTLVGQPAPTWSGTAYDNGNEASLSSSDLNGKWYVLYWYPLDFTFVCPTEIISFQELADDFADDNVRVIGVSTDSFFSHKAWFSCRETFPQEITHPVLADTNHEISRAFGVLKEDLGVGYRATVIVDNEGNVRSMAVNDLSVGRSPKEVLRTVQALQSGKLCGANWNKGDDHVG
ncbi:MAG: thioredoxin peroxidase [Planctomycetaceae bacterium]|nr:thioredoxin peroxidase [Planctomycetaceae bacterium]HAA71774.1 thioredoxin peroxidase [Planctomycetaceae bacterium]|tara:strand:- start:5497 stop:6021 length:525 start_codon:yes stop_codon:yes gene_type:complete